MTDGPPTPNPRLVLAFIAVVLAAQGVYAAIDILGGGLDTADPLSLATGVAFVVYVALIVAFAFGVWQRQRWAWPLAVVIAASGLALAGLRIVAGDAVEQHGIGMLIDGALLYYLFKPNVRGLFEA
jgi:hypothetical protein